jgi:hypothetical protein
MNDMYYFCKQYVSIYIVHSIPSTQHTFEVLYTMFITETCVELPVFIRLQKNYCFPYLHHFQILNSKKKYIY